MFISLLGQSQNDLPQAVKPKHGVLWTRQLYFLNLWCESVGLCAGPQIHKPIEHPLLPRITPSAGHREVVTLGNANYTWKPVLVK